MATSWRPSKGDQIRYFLIASFVLIGQIIGFLFFGLWIGQQINFWMSVLGAVLGGMIGLASGTFFLYRMALNWERVVLKKLGKQLCPKCKKSFNMKEAECPHCGYKLTPTIQNPSISD